MVLFPLSFVWAVVTRVRRLLYRCFPVFRSRFPIICVGNIHSGGSGKTPVSLEILLHLEGRGAVLVSRGYKGQCSRNPTRVNPTTVDGAQVYGDEPWMVAQQSKAPVYVGGDRAKVIRCVERDFERAVVVLDDGFQHLRLHRDVDFVVINADRTLEESFCLPLGDLREPLSALRAASAVLLTCGSHEEPVQRWQTFLKGWVPAVPVFLARRKSLGLWRGSEPLETDEKIVGFCGIAHPDRFVGQLKACHNSLFLKAFPDHHRYGESDVARLIADKHRHGGRWLVTTDKDWFKIGPTFEKQGEELLRLRIGYELSQDFWKFLELGLDRLVENHESLHSSESI